MAVTLLFLYSNSLLKLVDAKALRDWFQTVCTGGEKHWYVSLPINSEVNAGSTEPPLVDKSDKSAIETGQSWLSFTNGWLCATLGECLLVLT